MSAAISARGSIEGRADTVNTVATLARRMAEHLCSMRDSSAGPRDLWHRVSMRSLRILCLVAAAGWSSACFQMTTALKVNGDGSGTIEHRMLYTTAGLEKLRQFASLGGGRGLDPLSEQQARE